MSRSAWKSSFVDVNLIKKFDDLLLRSLDEFCLANNIVEITDDVLKVNKVAILAFARRLSFEEPLETWSRRSTVLPEFLGFYFNVYNGRDFHLIKINSHMISKKFGEFVFTKRIGTNIHFPKKGKIKKKS